MNKLQEINNSGMVELLNKELKDNDYRVQTWNHKVTQTYIQGEK